MKITWPEDYTDGDWIDLWGKLVRQRVEILRQYPMPKKGCSEEELEERTQKMTQAMKEYYDSSEDEKLWNSIREAVIEDVRKHGYHFTGDYHQNGPHGIPVVDDTYAIIYSCREWGAIMAEAWPDEEYKMEDNLRYIKWAWTNDEPKVVPGKERES